MTPKEYLEDKKMLVMGLGLLGGGIATTKWLIKHGAKVTVTDLKDKKTLASSIKALGHGAKRARFVLGKHDEKDFKNNEIIVVNPAVPKESKFLKIARDNGARFENEASLFFRFCKNPVIAVTGTRGKTTTVNWIHHFLKQKYPNSVLTGNSSDNPMLKVLDGLDGKSPVVAELSSWHLELLPQSGKSARVAVITNLLPDHLNRYKNLSEYASAKANIFKHQTKDDFLILNKNNKWTKFFLNQKPQS
ncbi:MAG: Mur ligase family protein, partial [Candidatus Omnitrophota bacterium]